MELVKEKILEKLNIDNIDIDLTNLRSETKDIENEHYLVKKIKFFLNEEETIQFISVCNKEFTNKELPIMVVTFENIILNKRLQKKYISYFADRGYNVIEVKNSVYTNVESVREKFNQFGLIFWNHYVKALALSLKYIEENIKYSSLSLFGISSVGAVSLASLILSGLRFENIILLEAVVDFDYMFANHLYGKLFSGITYFTKKVTEKPDNMKEIALTEYPEIEVIDSSFLVKNLDYVRMFIINTEQELFRKSGAIISKLDNRISNIIRGDLSIFYLDEQFIDLLLKKMDKEKLEEGGYQC